MFCENCGKKLNKGDKFCEYCGFEVKGAKKGTEIDTQKPEKFVSKFTLIFTGLILLAFFIFWIYEFGVFNPQKGTSTASASALWGQFIVSLLSVVVFDAILIFLDIRKKAVPIFKLVSFWLIVFVIILSSSLYTYKKMSYGKTHTYQEGQEFSYGSYSFTINGEFSDIGYNPEDCSTWGGRLFDRNYCETEINPRRKLTNETQKYLALKIIIKNNSNYEKPITTKWFQVFGASGKEYNLHDANFETSNLPSNSTREGTLSKIYVNRSEQEFNIKVVLPNKAKQIVKIKNR